MHIYIHIPYCKQACAYCDFYFSTNNKSQDDFIQALVSEIDAVFEQQNEKEILKTLYFGGGTPARLSIDKVIIIIEALKKYVVFDANIEITFEANPDDLNETYLNQLFMAGINRLSLGIQSLNNQLLKILKRAHNAKQALKALHLAQKIGFNNITIDLIYGIPGLTNKVWKQTLETITQTNVPHLSAYSLTIEPKTLLNHQISKGVIKPMADEKYIHQFETLINHCQQHGYEHYELSNFAQPNFRSKHNSAYWQNKKYIGLGPSAHSFDGHSRWKNVSNVHLYIDALKTNKKTIDFLEHLSHTDQINEYIMLRLRTLEGINKPEFENLYNISIQQTWGKKLQTLQKGNMIQENDKYIYLTKEGKILADNIIRQLFLD